MLHVLGTLPFRSHTVKILKASVVTALLTVFPAVTWAADDPQAPAGPATGQTPAQPPTVTCSSSAGGRTHCPADTSAGIALVRVTGGQCDLGRTWGYDFTSVWVSDGCSGEFVVGQAPAGVEQRQTPSYPIVTPSEPEWPTWGVIDATGSGVVVHRSNLLELSVGAYALVRYINQLPAEQQFTDHLGNVRDIDTRNDVQFHRAMIHFRGWLFNPKARYQITVWTVMSTDQTTLYGFLGYQFHKKFNVYGGINTLGGTRSVMGSHPFWLANDRVMADEFFRPSFTGGFWINGEVAPGLWYHLALANNLSQLGISAGQLDRGLGTGGTIWWMPTTHEFGPNGSYGDWDYHEEVATRFGVGTARSRETRQLQGNTSPENTQTKLADSLNVFDPGSLAPGVTVDEMNYRVLSIDAGVKYRGIFAQFEYYNRWLDDFEADGPLPVESIHDHGFYVQAAFYPIKKKLEVYGVTSQIFGDKDEGFGNSSEYTFGSNYYWFDSRNVRSNVQIMDVNRSPVGSVFGFYVGGQKGTTVSVATSFFF
jgi:hypothetical protein